MRISGGGNPSGLVALIVREYQLGQTEQANLLLGCGSLSPCEVIKGPECDRYAACLQKDKKP